MWDDVDLDAARVSVRRARVLVGHKVVDASPKTARSRRTVSLNQQTVAVLRAHRRRQLEDRLAAGSAWQETGFVFTREDGTPLHPDYVSQSWERRVKASGLPVIRLHDLRHTHASLALAAGVHPKVVSDRLGHSTTSMTLDTYSHVVPGLHEDARRRHRRDYLRRLILLDGVLDGRPRTAPEMGANLGC